MTDRVLAPGCGAHAVLAESNRFGLTGCGEPFRVELDASRRELADALGVHYQTIGYLERGEYNASLNRALRIAEFFGVPAEVVFSIDPFPRISERLRACRRGRSAGAGA